MTLRASLIVTLGLVTTATLYVCTVRRGDWGMREEVRLEVESYRKWPVRTRVYAEQRIPEYPAALQWLAPVFADVHAIDVGIRCTYWHEESFPDFDDAPDFELVK